MCALHIPGAYFAIDCLLNVECICILEQVWKITNIFIFMIVFQTAYHSDEEIEETETFVLITISNRPFT